MERQAAIPDAIVSVPPAAIEATKSSIVRRIVIEVVAITCWCYALAKLFVFDIDRFLLDRFAPSAIWLLDYKIFFIVGALALIVIFGRRFGALGLASFVLCYLW